MIAVINNAVAGAALALMVHFVSPSAPSWLVVAAGIAGALVLTWLFYIYQRWRCSTTMRCELANAGKGSRPIEP